MRRDMTDCCSPIAACCEMMVAGSCCGSPTRATTLAQLACTAIITCGHSQLQQHTARCTSGSKACAASSISSISALKGWPFANVGRPHVTKVQKMTPALETSSASTAAAEAALLTNMSIARAASVANSATEAAVHMQLRCSNLVVLHLLQPATPLHTAAADTRPLRPLHSAMDYDKQFSTVC